MQERASSVLEGGFRSASDFGAWIESLDQPELTAIGPPLAARAALRALPGVGFLFGRVPDEEATHSVLCAFRALQLFFTAFGEPQERYYGAASDAYVRARNAAERANSVNAFAFSALNASAYAAHTLISTSHGDLVTTINSAVVCAASNFKNQESFWSILTVDADMMVKVGQGSVQKEKMLWLSEPPADWTLEVSTLETGLNRASSNASARLGWQVWLDWFDAKVEGIVPWKLSRSQSQDIERNIAFGGGISGFWDRHPDEINADISGLLSNHGWGSSKETIPNPDGSHSASKMAAAKTQPSKNPAPKKKTKSKRDDATIAISISENDLSIPDNESAAKPESELHPATKRADLEPLADTVDGSVDHLGRANIAYALAGRINEVWDQMNKPGTGPQGAAPGFVIHIDAPWGGGKSTFAEHIAQILNPYIIKGALPAWLKALPIGKDGTWPERFRRPWHIVRFNAWQHQHVTPPWWVFYETIRETVTRQGAEETNRQEAALPAPAARFAYESGARRWFDATLLGLQEYAWRLFSPSFWFALLPLVLTVVAIYLLVKFGVIQTVQKDGKFEIGIPSNATGFIATTAGVLLGGGAALWRLWAAFTQTLLPGTPDAAKNFSLGSGDPLKRMKAHFVRLMERVHRPVLVIVDDLDRCEPAFVVELVRGMQTILASPRVVYLLLGDRDWIEQSFTEVHKAMKGVEVGPEHRFGGRFVEKAIQFSMVLPDVSEAGRQDYVRQLLTTSGTKVVAEPVTAPPSVLDSAAVPESQKKIVEDLKADAKEVLETDDYQLRELKAKSLADKFDLVQVDLSREAFNQEMAQKLFFRAATDSTAEKATAHMIEGMASILPANPRQIKRIINTLSLLGQVLRIKEPAKRPGSADWQMLARWVVLMVEWPKSWFTLTRHPGLADLALAIKQGKLDAEIDQIETTMKGLGFLPASGARSMAKLIAANPTVMRALDFQAGQDAQDSDWVKKPITANEIEWLRVVMPAASGQVLQPPQQERPASSDPAAAGKAA